MAGKWAVGAAAICACLAATAATAATPAGPDASKTGLQAADFPGSHAAGGKLGSGGPVTGGYERIIKLAKPYGASRYGAVISMSFVAGDVATATKLYAVLGHNFSQRQSRLSLVGSFLKGAGIKSRAKSASMIKPRGLGVSDSSMEIGFTIKGKGSRFNMSVTLLRIDRVVDMDIAVGNGSAVVLADALALTKLAATHITGELAPVAAAPPVVTGTAAQGQTLTASTGSWKGSPAAFSYQWQRCNSAGATCADLAGATGVTYGVTSADAGSTLRIVVTAKGRFGAATSPSAVTAVVA